MEFLGVVCILVACGLIGKQVYDLVITIKQKVKRKRDKKEHDDEV